MQVESFLELTAARSPEKMALVCNGRGFAYAGLLAMAGAAEPALSVTSEQKR
jgi:hypothetical protein